MNQDAAAIAKQLALLVETLERRSAAADQRLAQAEQRFTQTINAVETKVDQLVQGAEQRTAQTVRQSMDSAMSNVVSQGERAVAAFSTKPAQAGQALEQAIASAIARLQRLIVMAYSTVGCAMLLVIAGGALLLWHQDQSYEDARARTEAAQVSADNAALFAQVGVSSCGGQPCLKLNPKAPHWGAHGEYVMLAPKAGK